MVRELGMSLPLPTTPFRYQATRRTNEASQPQLGVAYVIITSVLFVFPPELPVTGTNMNYCIVVFAIVIIISGITWILDGRKNYRGPKIDEGLEVLEATKVGQVGSAGGDKHDEAVLGDDTKHVVEA